MDKPNVINICTIGTFYEAVIECKKCGKETKIGFTQKDDEIKMKYKAEEVARAYIEKTASPICGECHE